MQANCQSGIIASYLVRESLWIMLVLAVLCTMAKDLCYLLVCKKNCKKHAFPDIFRRKINISKYFEIILIFFRISGSCYLIPDIFWDFSTVI